MTATPGTRPCPVIGAGRFQVVDFLGEGGTGSVFLCWDRRQGGWVALKAMQYKFLKDDEMRSRFQVEAETMEQLSHSNVPRLIQWSMESSPPYLAMELARNGSTMDWVKANGPMPVSMACDVLFQICQALEACHELGIVHRDVKPHNFLLDDTGRCLLTDFGIARVDHTNLTATGSQLGTFSFMAPEQRSDTHSVTHLADIYALGASLFTLLTATTSAELFVADKEDDLLDDLPEPFRDFVLKACRYKPEERHGTVHEFQTELLNVLSRIPSDQGEYPPLVDQPEPLPDSPPSTISKELDLDDLLRSMGLELDQPTFVPSKSERQRLAAESSRAEPKVIPYYMPSGASESKREASDAVPSYIDETELERIDTSSPRAVVAEELPELPPIVAQQESVTLSPIVLRSALAGTLALVLVLMLLLGFGTYQVGQAAGEAGEAADSLVAVLMDDSSVAYEFAGESKEYEAIYTDMASAKGPDRLAHALRFSAAVKRSVAEGGMPSGAAEKVGRILTAAEEYEAARSSWAEAGGSFPGSLSVGLGLSSVPAL